MTVRILTGDCRDMLKSLPDESVHMVMCSPPYFRLRDYDVAGQIGLEETPEAFVQALVDVFREVRRVLRVDGTLWVNLGDSYAGSWGAQGKRETPGEISRNSVKNQPKSARTGAMRGPGLKPKDMIGIPWRVAFALQADGWYLRQDIIWHKPNPMPESVKDRCTKAHEYLFLLSKSERYWFDADAISEPASPNTNPRIAKVPQGWDPNPGGHGTIHRDGRRKPEVRSPKTLANAAGSRNNESFNNATAGRVVERRNKRSVWTIGTEPFPDAHFATYPPALVEPCILAGCPRGGGGSGSVRRGRDDRAGRQPTRPQRHPDRAQSGVRRDGRPPDSRRPGPSRWPAGRHPVRPSPLQFGGRVA